MKIQLLVKIALAIMLFLCVADMPYGYYQLVKLFGMVGFALLAFLGKDEEEKTFFFIWIISAILISPFLKLHLGRVIWNIVDVALGVIICYSIYYQNNKEE